MDQSDMVDPQGKSTGDEADEDTNTIPLPSELVSDTAVTDSENLYPGLREILTVAFKDALVESKDVFVSIIVEAMNSPETDRTPEAPLVLPYEHRLHKFKLLVQLSSIVLIALIVGTADVLLSNQKTASAVILIIFLLVCGLGLKFVSRVIEARAETQTKKTIALWATLIIVVLIVIGFFYAYVAAQYGVAPLLSYIVLGIYAVLAFIAARMTYIWRNFILKREDDMMRAVLPSNVWFGVFDEIDEGINVGELSFSRKQNFIMKRIGFSTVIADGEPELDQYWHKLHYVVDGEAFRKSIMQRRY